MGFILAILVGASTVLQGGLNKVMSFKWGVSGATLFNAFTFLFFTIVLFSAINFVRWDKIPSYMKVVEGISAYRWWYWLPGVLGTIIVFGIPVGIIEMGALRTMTIVICSQIIISIIWDIYVEKIPVNTYRLLGVFCSVLGAFLISFKS